MSRLKNSDSVKNLILFYHIFKNLPISDEKKDESVISITDLNDKFMVESVSKINDV